MEALSDAKEGRLDTLIGEIESSDSPIGPVLRYVLKQTVYMLFQCLSLTCSKALELKGCYCYCYSYCYRCYSSF